MKINDIVNKVLKEKNLVINEEPKDDIPSYNEQVEFILQNFDFETMHNIMRMKIKPKYDDYGDVKTMEPWVIVNKDNFLTVPSTKELIILAGELLEQVINMEKEANKVDYYYASTGPFKAINRWGILELEFIMDSISWD